MRGDYNTTRDIEVYMLDILQDGAMRVGIYVAMYDAIYVVIYAAMCILDATCVAAECCILVMHVAVHVWRYSCMRLAVCRISSSTASTQPWPYQSPGL